MADREVTIRIKLDPSQFQSGASQVTGELSRIEGQVQKTGGVFDGLAGYIAGAFTIGAMVSFGEQLITVGRQAETVERTFQNLAGPVGGAAAVLDELNRATNWTISDRGLEQIASKALLTGVAETKDELGLLVEVGSKLGTAMGMTAAEGVDNLNAAILNMSFVRLDQMGLSAARVRTEMDMLLATGQAMSREEAFKMAVLDQGKDAMSKLGDFTDTADTKLQQYQKRWEDFLANTGKNAVGVVGEILTKIDEFNQKMEDEKNTPGTFANWNWVRGGGPEMEAEKAKQAAEAARNAQIMATASTYSRSWDDSALTETMLAQRPWLRQLDSMTGSQTNGASMLASLRASRGSMIGEQTLFSDEDAVRAQNMARSMEQLYKDASMLAEKHGDIFSEDVVDRFKQGADEAKKVYEYIQKGADLMRTASLSDFLGQGIQNRAQADLGGMVLDYARGQGMEGGGLQNWQDAIDKATGAQNDASLTIRDKMVPALYEIGQKFGQNAMIDALNALTTEIQQAKLTGREANLSLATLGYMGGGQQQYTVGAGESYAAISKATGLSVAQIMQQAGITDSRRLRAGQELQFGQGLMPIGTQYTVNQGAGPGKNPNLSGMFFGGPADAKTGPPVDFSQYAEDAGTLMKNLGTAAENMQTLSDSAEPLNRYMTDVQELLSTVSQSDLPAATTAAQGFYDVLFDSRSTTEDIQAAFKDLTSKIQTIKVKINVDAPQWFVTAFSSGNLAQVIRNNGGSVPGARG